MYVTQKVKDEQEYQHLESLRRIESASLARVEASGMFKNVQPDTVAAVAHTAIRQGQICLRPGAQELCVDSTSKQFDIFHALTKFRLMQSVYNSQQNPCAVHIISVAWSASFILAAIQESFLKAINNSSMNAFSASTAIEVHANEINDTGSGTIEGSQICQGRRILTIGDKSRAMATVIDLHRQNNPEAQLRTLFVGDSQTDLQCLMEADIGICMRDQPVTSEQRQLQESLARLEVPVEHISTLRADSTRTSKQRKLYFAFNFEEILRSEFGCQILEIPSQNGG